MGLYLSVQKIHLQFLLWVEYLLSQTFPLLVQNPEDLSWRSLEGENIGVTVHEMSARNFEIS